MLTTQSYADDILMRGARAAELAARIQRLATGCATEADTHFDPAKSAWWAGGPHLSASGIYPWYPDVCGECE